MQAESQGFGTLTVVVSIDYGLWSMVYQLNNK